MKKDKYPLAGGLMSDPSRPGSVGMSRDAYSGMNGYMPNGYGYDASSMYGQSPYSSSHMSSSPSSIYSRYDMGGMYPSSTSSASAMSSYMNGSMYASMYGPGGSSPYSMGPGPISPEGEGGEGCVSHHSHSPGSVKSEAGVSGPPTGSSTVSMGSGSPGSAPQGIPPGPPSGPMPAQVKREPMTGPPTPGSHQQPRDLNSMISMYLPGDMAAAEAGDPQARARIYSMQQHLYSTGQYGSLMSGHPPMSHSPDLMGGQPPSAYPV